MSTRIWINQLEFSDGSTIDFEKNDIVVFVGPNNAGKSASLKECAGLLRSRNKPKNKVIKKLVTGQEGSKESLISFLEQTSKKHYSDNNEEPYFQGFGYNVYAPHAKKWWDNITTNGLGELTNFFISTLNTEERLKIADPASNIRLTRDAISHPIHYLQKDDELEKRFSGYVHQAFGQDLIVHRNAGNIVPLYVGQRPIPKEGEDRVSVKFIEELEKLDLLHEQGDGMRSFVGVLLNAFISNHSVHFVDEPEAFLHPPQARLLGKMLAKDLPSERQLFIATHSEDFLKGLLDANISNLKIIRIQRDGAVNTVSVLHSKDIINIWGDSLLRHSNVLNGLFHTKVILCESDSDCRFFSAISAVLHDDTMSIAPDILFIHCGGKHRMPMVVRALMKLNVPLKVVSDFDVLNDINPIQEIYEGLGGNWSDVKSDWSIVKAEIEQKRPELLSEEVKKEINDSMSLVKERIFPKEKIIQIQKILKKASAWSEAKSVGKPFIPSGNATQSFEKIQAKFKARGLIILEVGELEGFAKSVGGHGPKWVNEVLQKNLKLDEELSTARQFVHGLIS